MITLQTDDSALNPLARALAAAALPAQRAIGRRRLERVVLERVDGVPLLVLPDTFNPVVFRTGAFFTRTLAAGVFLPGRDSASVLDMGTGTGIAAVFAALSGHRVTAVDINPSACRCARINALLNGVEDRVEVAEGNLFGPLAGRRFDTILFNPPFFRGTPKTALDRAWRSEDVLERFAAGVASALAPDGKVYVVLSSHGEGGRLARLLADSEFDVRPLRRRDFGTEMLTVYEARLSKGGWS